MLLVARTDQATEHHMQEASTWGLEGNKALTGTQTLLYCSGVSCFERNGREMPAGMNKCFPNTPDATSKAVWPNPPPDFCGLCLRPSLWYIPRGVCCTSLSHPAERSCQPHSPSLRTAGWAPPAAALEPRACPALSPSPGMFLPRCTAVEINIAPCVVLSADSAGTVKYWAHSHRFPNCRDPACFITRPQNELQQQNPAQETRLGKRRDINLPVEWMCIPEEEAKIWIFKKCLTIYRDLLAQCQSAVQMDITGRTLGQHPRKISLSNSLLRNLIVWKVWDTSTVMLYSLSFSLERHNYLSFKAEICAIFRFSSAIWQLDFGWVE